MTNNQKLITIILPVAIGVTGFLLTNYLILW
jgi:hypothetical protein